MYNLWLLVITRFLPKQRFNICLCFEKEIVILNNSNNNNNHDNNNNNSNNNNSDNNNNNNNNNNFLKNLILRFRRGREEEDFTSQ